MRVLHLTTSESGGAGLAACRLAEAQTSANVDSQILSNQNKYQISIPTHSRMLGRFESKLITAINTVLTNKKYPAQSIFSISGINQKYIVSLKPDIIHIHNWYNFLSFSDFRFLMKNYIVVFTMHDMRLLTGGCHYSVECKNLNKGCNNCPQTRKPLKFNAIQKRRLEAIFAENRNRYAVIAPSVWLSDLAERSAIGKFAREVLPIPNVINNTNTYLSEDLHFKSNLPKLLFVAHDMNSSIKGFDLLLAALLKLQAVHKIEFQLTTVGRGFEKINIKSNLVVTHIEHCNQDRMRNLMKLHDAIVVPSRADNSPNVISEAQANGLIVIGSEVGGIPELVSENETGFVFKPNIESLAESLIRFYNAKNLDSIRTKAREFALKRDDVLAIVDRHISLYQRLSNEK